MKYCVVPGSWYSIFVYLNKNIYYPYWTSCIYSCILWSLIENLTHLWFNKTSISKSNKSRDDQDFRSIYILKTLVYFPRTQNGIK
jgi:hypothetical protein